MRYHDKIVKQVHGMTAKEWSEKHGIDCNVDPDTGEEVKGGAHQEFKAECDLNNILDKYLKTGKLPDLIRENPAYGDFSAVPDFLEAQNIVAKAHEQFDSLDAHIRKRFGNDPAQFLEFATNGENAAEMIKLGLAQPRVEKTQPEPSQAQEKPISKATKPKEPKVPKEAESE